MKNFLQEALFSVGLEDTLPRITLLCFGGILVEGGKLLSAGETEIVCTVLKKKTFIRGEHLYLQKITPDALFIRGFVQAIEVENV